MTNCCRKVTMFLKKCDLFASSQLLRYRGEPEYSTATGGVTSLVIICMFIALFASMGLQTAKRQIIHTSMSSEHEQQPSFVNVTVDGSNFLVAFGVMGFDLNDPTVTYFDLQLTQNFVSFGMDLINSTIIPLEKCTEAHWNSNEQIGQIFDKYTGWQWKCVPLGTNLTIGGKRASKQWGFVTLTISKCDATAHANCIPDVVMNSIFDVYGDFSLGIGFGQTVINPSLQKYKSHYLQDRNFFPFSLTRGIFGESYFIQTEVQTDESLMPYEQIRTQNFVAIPELFDIYPATVRYDNYATMNFNKASTKVTHKRSFNKVDNYFSYVGGLIGTILGFIVILNAYAELAYGVSMASQLFTHDDEEKISSKGFHLGYLLTIHFYRLCDALGCCLPNWPQTKAYSQCIDEVQEQLDVANIMKRLLFFQRALGSLLSPHQLQALQLHPRITLTQAQENRKKYDLMHKIRKKQLNDQIQATNESKQDIARGMHNPDLLLPSQWGGSQRQQTIHTSEELSAPSVSSIAESAQARVRHNLTYVMASAERGDAVSRKIVEGMRVTLSPELKLRKVGKKNRKNSHIQLVESKNIFEDKPNSFNFGTGSIEDIQGFE